MRIPFSFKSSDHNLDLKYKMYKQNILLLTKNYPPQVGGIEKYAYDLYNRLIQDGNHVNLIAAWARNEYLLANCSRSFLWKFCYIVSEFFRLLSFTLKALILGLYYARKTDLIWCLDWSLAWVGLFLKKLTSNKFRITIHGTDITWSNKLYQFVIPKFISFATEVYVISENTRLECLKRHVSPNKISLIPHNINSISCIQVESFNKNIFLQDLWIANSQSKIILFSIGRWVERKGFHWFLESILPKINSQRFHYILAGFGLWEQKYRSIIGQKSIHNVTLLGKVNDSMKARLFSSSDYFIMPNIKVEDDLEWFGLVLLEAQFYWINSIVSDVDGLNERVLGSDLVFKERDDLAWISWIESLYNKKYEKII